MLEQILARIDAKLSELGLAESAAAKMAGLSDSAIRNMRRSVKKGETERGASVKTLEKLAPVLRTTVAWLMTGETESSPTPAWEIYLMIADMKLTEADVAFIKNAVDYVRNGRDQAA